MTSFAKSFLYEEENRNVVESLQTPDTKPALQRQLRTRPERETKSTAFFTSLVDGNIAEARFLSWHLCIAGFVPQCDFAFSSSQTNI